MKEQLEQIYSSAVADIEKAATVKDLENIKFKYLTTISTHRFKIIPNATNAFFFLPYLNLIAFF